ncbi:Uncharacterised protein [Klebsiella pneumoniae]|nr:Uncharacterised protein [Klebsiella pneumoniae]
MLTAGPDHEINRRLVMKRDMTADILFTDILSRQFAALHLCYHLFHTVGDIPASAVVSGDIQL